MGSKLNRRSFFRVVGAGAAATGSALLAFQPRWARATDRDPNDPASTSSARGVSDRDPTDPAGRGTGAARSGAVTTCRLGGDCELVQSDGNIVNIHFDRLSRATGRFLGTASNYSRVLGGTMTGSVEGTLIGRDFRMRIHWHRGRSRRNTGPLGLGREYVPEYNETGIYTGRVRSNGELRGNVSPFERPNVRETWFIRGYIECGE